VGFFGEGKFVVVGNKVFLVFELLFFFFCGRCGVGLGAVSFLGGFFWLVCFVVFSFFFFLGVFM